MGGFLLARTIDGIIKIAIVSMILFAVLVVLPPGDPAARFAGKMQDPAKIKQINHTYCFDKGNVGAYACFVKMTVTGNFKSPSQGDTNIVPRAIKAVPVTFGLAVLASIFWLAAGITAGAKGALRAGSRMDRSLMVLSLIGISFPTAWLSLLLLKTFTADFGFFPPGGYVGISDGGAFSWLHHMLLPAFTLAVVSAGVYTRMTRTTVRQKLREEYVKTAEAKGLPGRQVFFKHVMRTAMIPIVVMFGMDFAALLGGAIFTESIFGLPGLGNFVLQAMHSLDFSMLFVGGLIAATFVIVSNTLVDLVQALLDPKLRAA
ncbi:MAG: binding-protein-dependent transport system inner rane component [Thermoleophilia bacterium]|nr:binding-protein-dependent transport system inner rane component [Thermoleophilia bacterium]